MTIVDKVEKLVNLQEQLDAIYEDIKRLENDSLAICNMTSFNTYNCTPLEKRSIHIYRGLEKLADALGLEVLVDDDERYFIYKGRRFIQLGTDKENGGE